MTLHSTGRACEGSLGWAEMMWNERGATGVDGEDGRGEVVERETEEERRMSSRKTSPPAAPGTSLAWWVACAGSQLW
jgi:hypothetical protein